MERFSKKREAIYACLCGTDTHPTAEWIYQKVLPVFPDISLATVYRNLNQLLEAGRIRSIGVVNGETHFDATVDPHAHLICSRCGAIHDCEDLFSDASLISIISSKSGYKIQSVSLQFYGLCPDCQS